MTPYFLVDRDQKMDVWKKIRTFFRKIYIHSPINFSTITGFRYPGIPRLKGNLFLGRLTNLFRENGVLENVLEAGKLARNHPSGMCYFWIGPQLALLITRIDDIYQLKIKHDGNVSKDLPLLKQFAGSSIFTDDAETWHKKRHICQKNMFNPEALEKLEPHMKAVIDRHVDLIQYHKNSPVDLRTFFYNTVVDVVTSNLLGSKDKSFDLQSKKKEINELSETAKYLTIAMRDVFEFRSVFKWAIPAFLRKIFFRNEINDFELVKKEMRERFYELVLNPNRASILSTDNMLREIWQLNHSANPGTEFSNEEIFADGLFLLSAGVATTVATLEIIMKLLVAHPEVADKLRTEIDTVINGEEITVQKINQISYLDMVIKEAMRLYPPVPLFLPREVTTPININGVPLFKGDLPLVSAYLTHRLEEIWEQPELFIPERFSKENADKIPKTGYMPFHIGPRLCVGQQFALQEMKLILTAIYRKYLIEIEDNDFSLTLKQGGFAPKVPPVARFIPR